MPKRLYIKLSSLGLSLLLAAGGLSPVFAQDDAFRKIGQFENVLFGKISSATPIEKRLQDIEKQLFGKAKKGESTASRIESIEKVMSGSKYLPPVAPQLDRSEFAPEPKKAPENPSISDREIGRDTEAPPPADAAERTKGMLRQAMQFYSQGKTAEAERLYRQVLAIDFRNSDANYNLGAIAESKNDLTAAQRYYSAALRASPGDRDIEDALGAVREKMKKLTTASAQSPASAPAADLLEGGPATAGDRAIAAEAAAAYKKGNFDDAIQKLAYLARKNPYDANTQFALGQAFRGKGDLTNANKHLRSAAALDPKNDLYVKSLNELASQNEEREPAGSSDATAYGRPSRGFQSGERPEQTAQGNDVTPFVGLPNSNSRAPSDDLSAIDDYLRKNSGNGVMIGSITSYGNPFGGGGLWSGGGLPGMPMMLGVNGSTRFKRIMTSSLSGAAMGAMANRGMPGGMSKGAMRGAMYGGLFGLMTGGF